MKTKKITITAPADASDWQIAHAIRECVRGNVFSRAEGIAFCTYKKAKGYLVRQAQSVRYTYPKHEPANRFAYNPTSATTKQKEGK